MNDLAVWCGLDEREEPRLRSGDEDRGGEARPRDSLSCRGWGLKSGIRVPAVPDNGVSGNESSGLPSPPLGGDALLLGWGESRPSGSSLPSSLGGRGIAPLGCCSPDVDAALREMSIASVSGKSSESEVSGVP